MTLVLYVLGVLYVLYVLDVLLLSLHFEKLQLVW